MSDDGGSTEYYEDISLAEADQYHARAIEYLRTADYYFLATKNDGQLNTVAGSRIEGEDDKDEKYKVFVAYVLDRVLNWIRRMNDGT